MVKIIASCSPSYCGFPELLQRNYTKIFVAFCADGSKTLDIMHVNLNGFK